MAIAGIRGTGNWAADERPKNFRETILWRDPNGMTPLTALMAKASSEATDDAEYNWWEEQLNAVRVQDNSTLGNSTSSTAVTLVSGGELLVPGDLLLVEKADATTYDNEIIEVSSVTSDTSISVKRAQCGTSVAAAGATAYLTKIGNRYAEGSASPSSVIRNPTKVTNYCQIFKTAYEMSGSAAVTKTRTGDPLKNDKKRKMFDHAVAMEMAFLYGKKHETTGANGLPLRTTGGLRERITTNRTVFSTTPTIETFLDAVYPVFDYAGSGAGNERIVFAGNGALNTLNKLIAASSGVEIKYDGIIKLYGMALQQFVTPQGVFYIKSHPLMNTHPRYTYSMFVINGAGIKYRYLTGRDTKAQENIQANDSDTKKGQWLTEAGLEIEHERTFAYLGNMTKP